jgi:hypothetical protein
MPSKFRAVFPVFLFAASSLLSLGQGPFICGQVTSSSPLLRAGGESELVGEIQVGCSGGVAGNGFTTTVDVSLSAAFTGLITDASGSWTEALLTVDDPSSPALGGNVLQGQLVGANQIRFSGVQLTAPGDGGVRLLRISNLRVQVPALGGEFWLKPAQVSAFLSMSSVPVPNPQVIVGFVQTGVRMHLLDSQGAPVSAIGYTGSSSYRLRFTEGFAGAFRKRNVATTVHAPSALAAQDQFGRDYGTESGVYLPGLGPLHGAGQAGLASHGTRLRASFPGVPPGATISVSAAPRSDSSHSATARLIQAGFLGSGPYVEMTPGADGRVILPSGPNTPEAVWEVLGSDATAIEELTFDVVVTMNGTYAGVTWPAGGFGPGLTAPNQLVPAFAPRAWTRSSSCFTNCLAVPSALAFRHRAGDPAPAAQSVPVRSTGTPVSYSAAVATGSAALGIAPPDADWLRVEPSTGTTPGSISVSVAPEKLPPGKYEGLLSITAGGFSEYVYVLLEVTSNFASPVSPLVCEPLQLAGIIRASGLTEPASSILLQCNSTSPVSGTIVSDIRVSLDTEVTSRDGASGSEALLLVNEPAGTPAIQMGVNAFRGERQGASTVVFRSVPVPVTPGGYSNLRIVNLRANASRIGVSQTQVANQVTATVRASNLAIRRPVVPVGYVQHGHAFRLFLPIGSTTLQKLAIPSGAGAVMAAVEFRELFGDAFRIRNAGTDVGDPDRLVPQDRAGGTTSTWPLGFPNETGFYAPAVPGLGTAGLATQGTRFMVRFRHVPRGVRLYMTVIDYDDPPGWRARMTHTDHLGAGAFQSQDATAVFEFPSLGFFPVAEIPVHNREAVAAWEATGVFSFLRLDTVRFAILAFFDGTEAGNIDVEGFLGPLSNDATANANAPMPRHTTAAPTAALCPNCVRSSVGVVELTDLTPSAEIALTADANPVIFTASTGGIMPLRLDRGAGKTPATLRVTAEPVPWLAGAYTGWITVNERTIPVRYTVQRTSAPEPGSAALSLSVARLEMSFAQGAAAAAQTVRLDGTPGLGFTAVSSLPWLLVSPGAGTLPATLTVSANTGAVAPGEYAGRVTVTAAGAGSQTLPVRISVTEQPQFLPTPSAVRIEHALGSTAATVVLYVTSKGRQTKYTAEARSAGGWLSVSPESGMTPVNLRLTYNAAGLGAGTYTGSILLTSTDGAGGPLSVPVTLEVR